jgi:hypothetical protein
MDEQVERAEAMIDIVLSHSVLQRKKEETCD